jgi:hypothetical protein
MVNNSTNINKTNNHLSSKESLNSDGQQYDQYQENKHLPLTLVCWPQIRHMAMEIQVLAWDSHKNVAGFNLLLEFQSSWYWWYEHFRFVIDVSIET